MAETIKVLVSEEEVNERIKTLGKQISENYAGKQIHMICVLKGGVFFMCELAKRISVPVSLDFMCVSSYGDATTSSGVVRITQPAPPGKNRSYVFCTGRDNLKKVQNFLLILPIESGIIKAVQKHAPVCRNGRRGGLKIPCANNTCGFDPHHRHKKENFPSLSGGVFFFICGV